MKILSFSLLLLSLTACTEVKPSETSTPKNEKMKNYVAMFEIPAIDISRAIQFYQSIFDIKIEQMDVGEMQMGIFPYENQLVNAVIVKGKDYQPSANGVTVYLNGGDDLQLIVDKIKAHQGKILVPKTAHADGNGFFAVFIDSEGNKMGLNSPR